MGGNDTLWLCPNEAVNMQVSWEAQAYNIPAYIKYPGKDQCLLAGLYDILTVQQELQTT